MARKDKVIVSWILQISLLDFFPKKAFTIYLSHIYSILAKFGHMDTKKKI